MKISVSSGKYDVIGSGLVIADSWNSNIEFHLHISNLLIFNIILVFLEKEKEKRKLEIETGNNTVTFNCINFEDTSGTAYPLEIATVKGKKIFLSFRNYGEKDIMRKIEYTFFVEK